MWLLLLSMGCGEPRWQPWNDGVPFGEVAEGAFYASIDSELPGSGWYTSESHAGRDASRAFMLRPRASEPVVAVQIYGRADDGWNVLELDVPLPFWVAGPVPLDGYAASGLFTQASGTQFVVLDGTLHIDQPGSLAGEVVSGRFEGVELGLIP